MTGKTLTSIDTLFFLCNGDERYGTESGPIINSELPGLMKSKIAAGEHFNTDWSCWNAQSIKIGDRAYLLRSGSQPKGVIAAGYVIAASPEQQLRNLHAKYSHLSEAYIYDQNDRFYVYLGLDSVVDFDCPLEQKNLKNLPQFQGVNFNFGRGGVRFAPSNPEAVQALASEWEKHSLIHQRQGKGRRLVDVFLERGDQDKQAKNYKSAVSNYKKALEVNPNYSKAINQLKACERILEQKL